MIPMSKIKPTMPIKFEKCIERKEPPKIGVYNRIYYRDADGDLWYYDAAKAAFDMAVECPHQVWPEENTIYPLCGISKGHHNEMERCVSCRRAKSCPGEKHKKR